MNEERTKLISPLGSARRLADTLRAEANGNDLQGSNQGDHLIRICAETEEGDFYEIGTVTAELFAQNPSHARKAIGMVKFPPQNH